MSEGPEEISNGSAKPGVKALPGGKYRPYVVPLIAQYRQNPSFAHLALDGF